MKVVVILLLATSICFAQDALIVGNIEAICNASRPDEAWIVRKGQPAHIPAKDYFALHAGDQIASAADSRVMIFVRYALPTEAPVLVTRDCLDKKAQGRCLASRFIKFEPDIFCLNSASASYTVVTPKADDAISEKISRLFHDAFNSFVHVEQIDMSVVPQPYRNERQSKNSPLYQIEPRHCLVDHPHFVWRGPADAAYSIKVYAVDSDEPIYVSPEIMGMDFSYPKTAPQLKGGRAYLWELEVKGLEPQRIQFEIADEGRLQALEAALSVFKNQKWENYSPSTIVLIKASALIEQGFYADARDLLLQQSGPDRTNPVAHAMLKQIYEKQAMYDLAKEERERVLEMQK